MARQFTLDDFYRVCTEVALPNKKTVTVRTLSDGETQLRERACTQALAKKTRELKDQKSDVYAEVISPYLATDDRDSLLQSLTSLKRGEFLSVRRETSRPEIVVIPDGATPEEQAEALERREKAYEAWEQEAQAGVDADVAALLKRAEKWSVEDIRKELVASMIVTQGRIAYLDELEARTLQYACYMNGKPMFKSREDVDKITVEVKRVLLEAYQEVYGVDPWALEDFFVTET